MLPKPPKQAIFEQQPSAVNWNGRDVAAVPPDYLRSVRDDFD
jgi:hypothetical protein